MTNALCTRSYYRVNQSSFSISAGGRGRQGPRDDHSFFMMM